MIKKIIDFLREFLLIAERKIGEYFIRCGDYIADYTAIVLTLPISSLNAIIEYFCILNSNYNV